MLLTGIATVLGCKTVYHEEGPNRRYHVFGMAADLLRFEVLFQSLIVQMQRELERALSRVLAQGAQRKVYSRDFMAGYRVTVRRRLEEAEKAARSAAETGRGEQAGSAGTSVALAIVDRTALVDRKLAEVYPKLTKARPRQARSGAGVLAGVEAGNRANITGGTDLAGGSARGALPR
jgi:hypothetical protein